MQDLRPIDAIAKPDVLERDGAADRRQYGTAGAGRGLRASIEDVPQSLDRQAGLMKILPDLGNAQHRRTHAVGQHVEGHQLADSEAAFNHQLCPEKENGDGNQMVHELYGLARDIAEADDAEACRNVAGKLLLPTPVHLRLHRQRLQRLDTGDALHQERLVLGAPTKLFIQPSAEQRGGDCRNAEIERKRAENDERQFGRVDEHHRKEDGGKQKIDDESQRRARQEVAYVFQLLNAGNGVADATRLKIGQRQRYQMAIKPRAQLDVDAIGRMGKKVGTQGAERCLEHRDNSKTDDQNFERAQSTMHENLVDDDLEEQRADEREDLQEERSDQHLAQQAAIFMYGTQEPGDIEPPRKIRERRATRHQDQTTVPERFEFSAGQFERAGLRGTQHQDLVALRLAKQDKAAIIEGRDRRQGRTRKTRPFRVDRSRFKSELLRASQHLRDADAPCAQPVTELLLLGRNTMQSKQQDKDEKPRFLVRRHLLDSLDKNMPEIADLFLPPDCIAFHASFGYQKSAVRFGQELLFAAEPRLPGSHPGVTPGAS